jgi:mono/diheme cytochrome c family protein
MKPFVKSALTVAGTLCAVAAGALLFVASGIYDIGADDHHTQLVLTLIERLRERSISARLDGIRPSALEQPVQIVAGADLYAIHCVGCHLAPGMVTADLRPGLYPHPPNLAMAPGSDPRRVFWAIKHGIKMSAMPTWGKSLSDAEIWEIVAFVRKMPAMSQEAYLQLLKDGNAQ